MNNRELNILGSRRYDWDEWLKRRGQQTLTKGEDFNGMEYSFANLFRQAAKRKGYTVSISIGEGHIRYTVTGRVKDGTMLRKGGKK